MEGGSWGRPENGGAGPRTVGEARERWGKWVDQRQEEKARAQPMPPREDGKIWHPRTVGRSENGRGGAGEIMGPEHYTGEQIRAQWGR